jgi:hypothetical protein
MTSYWIVHGTGSEASFYGIHQGSHLHTTSATVPNRIKWWISDAMAAVDVAVEQHT